ncbi:MAG: hypothetical protein HOP16_10330 [Acidobacteria bacterium]|jgi:hypothetical protein|nr:hypothetical protein [Acidobacteriota bacterium]
MWKALMSAASVLCVLSATAAAAQDRPRTGDEFVKVAGTEELFPRCKRGKRQAIGVSGAADGEFAPRTRQP